MLQVYYYLQNRLNLNCFLVTSQGVHNYYRYIQVFNSIPNNIMHFAHSYMKEGARIKNILMEILFFPVSLWCSQQIQNQLMGMFPPCFLYIFHRNIHVHYKLIISNHILFSQICWGCNQFEIQKTTVISKINIHVSI